MDPYGQPYMSIERRQVKEVRCKGECQRALLVQRGISQHFRLDKTKDYGEVQIEMQDQDGTIHKHQTAMCASCRERILNAPTMEELENIFAQDVRMWVTESVALGSRRADAEQMVTRFVWRRPTGSTYPVA